MLPEHPTSYFNVHIPTIQNNYFTAFSPSSKLQTNPTSKLSLTNDVFASFTWQSRRPIGKCPRLSLGVTTPLVFSVHPIPSILHRGPLPPVIYSFSFSYLKILPISLIIFISKQVCPSHYPLFFNPFTSHLHSTCHLISDPLHNHISRINGL